MAGKRIVILGGGFGGAYCAAALERRLRRFDPPVEVLLINRTNYFVYYPLLIEAGTGHLEPRHAVVSLRAFLKRTTFRMADVTGVDVAAGRVRYRVGGRERVDEAEFDHLVIAMGSVTMLPPVEGLAEHGFEMKSLADAVALRDRAIRHLEIADATEDRAERRALLHFVVVGANFTGVEVAGEFHELLTRAARGYPNVEPGDVSVTLIDRDSRILPALDVRLADYAADRLRRRGVNIELNNTATRITAEGVTLGDGRTLSARTLIWAAGIAPSPMSRALGLPTDQRGYIDCERDLRVRGLQNVWAIGDIAVNRDASGKPYPATAQHALRQGEHLARNLERALRGEATLPCDIDEVGSIASIGCRSAVASVMGVRISGFAAWWLYRTVYLMKMPGATRRVRLALDWTVGLFFRPDDVQLGLHRPAAARDNAPPPR